jgi:Fur family transcriptional regulator, ferric uptake regulator
MPRGRCRRGFGYQEFEEAGYRFTTIRQVIVQVLENANTHLSVEDIFKEVQKQCNGVNLTTIYRNLEILINLNMVLKYDFGDGRARYELVKHIESKPFHLHLICKLCGRVIDVDDFMSSDKKREHEALEKKYNFKIEEEIYQFRGVCSFCA